MPDYKSSKIYAIKSEQASKFYIGSTTKRLCSRMAQHRQNYNKYLEKKIDYDCSFDILQYSDAQIQLLESFECNNKDELNAKLQTFINNYKDKAVNKPKEKKIREKKEKKIKVKSKEKPIKEQPKEQPKEEIKKEESIKEGPPKYTNRLQALRAGIKID